MVGDATGEHRPLAWSDHYCQHVPADLDRYAVRWEDITHLALRSFTQILDGAGDERPLQAFLEATPHLLVQHLRGGYGRWVVPRVRLGSEFVPDFLVAEESSSGLEWYLVELQ